MNKNLNKLCGIGNKKSRRIIGLMSGTSLDGLDIAVCEISGCGLTTELSLIAFETIAYGDFFKEEAVRTNTFGGFYDKVEKR